MKNSAENAHQISLTLPKVEVWGPVDMLHLDLELGPVTLVLKLDLDMVVTYLHAKHQVNRSSDSKVIIRIHKQTARQTDRGKTFTCPKIRGR